MVNLRYEAYLDASGGKDRGQSTVAFAGVLSPARRWLRFSKQWCAALNADNLPSFHASEFLGKHGLFEDMTNEVQERVLGKLIRALTDHCWFTFGGAIETTDYERELSAESKAVFWTPEQLAFYVCMIQIVGRLETVPGETVAVVADQDDTRRMQAVTSAYNLIRKNEKFGYRFRAIGFADHRLTVPLQAADLVVNQLFRHQRDGLVTQSQLRPVLLGILDKVQSHIVTITPELLRFYDEGLRKIIERDPRFCASAIPSRVDQSPLSARSPRDGQRP